MDDKDNVKVLMTLFGSITGHMSVIEYIKDEVELPTVESVKMTKYTGRDRLMHIAEKYADENYPDWEDEKGISKKLSKEE